MKQLIGFFQKLFEMHLEVTVLCCSFCWKFAQPCWCKKGTELHSICLWM